MTHTAFRLQGSTREPDAAHRGTGLLMTATLVPPAGAVARNDPEERLKDYLDALDFYLSLPRDVVDRILFVDNSNADLNPLLSFVSAREHDKDVELISFAGNDHPVQRGKAYGEFRLMDFGLAQTSLFAPDDLIWKTTGRLRFLNLAEMSRQCSGMEFDILCDLRNVPWVNARKWRDHENMDLRVFAFRRRAYDAVFRGLWQDHEEGFDANFLFHRVRESFPGLRIIHRFPVQPVLQGISGRHLHDYLSPQQQSKDAIRRFLRMAAPWLWL
ncbi:hypothetical protein [Accumulibacter sp.]|uniref:hypothetical protein n=1 Tax=Accumulibacter sp. TaxID=2053492 RepID=UPI0025E0FD09|nr:hypothetical protein [Accumulibacter sp.]MCM8595406.1 hypothetical protein [Accumulibacter sp.]MCM8626413.1 hypothetical protein [Accumulibacter sp.]MDS4049553.1 hypothetical protein [Accumulibacter sp.]